MDLWFSTGIAGITKPAVTGVEWTQVAKFPEQAKKQIKQDIVKQRVISAMSRSKTLNTHLFNVASAGNPDEDNMVLAAQKVFDWTDPNVISQMFQWKMSNQAFKDMQNMAYNAYLWSWASDLQKAYPWYSKSVIDDIITSKKAIIDWEEWPWVLQNTVSGLLWQVPQLWFNLLRTVVHSVNQNTPTYLSTNLIDALHWTWVAMPNADEKTDKELAWLKELANKAQAEIVWFVWWDPTSKSSAIWEAVAEILPFVLTKKLWWTQMAVEWTSALTDAAASTKLPMLTKLIKNKFVQRLIHTSIESVPSTIATTSLTEWHLPTKEEYAMWAWANLILWSTALKKQWKLEKLIAERPSSANIREWVTFDYLKDIPSKLNKRWNWQWNPMKLSERSERAVDVIKKEIKGFSVKNIWKLYGQIDTTIWKLWDSLWWALKNIKTQWFTKMRKDTSTLMEEAADSAIDYDKPMYNKMIKAIEDFKNHTNWEEAWNAAKKFDMSMPKSIKNALGKWGKEEVLYGYWRQARNAINDYLEAISENTDANVKSTFRKMTDLYHWKEQLLENAPDIYAMTPWMKQKLKWLWGTLLKLWVIWAALKQGGVSKTWVAE